MTKFTNPCPLEQELNEQYYKALEKEINKEILKEVSQKMKMGEGYCPRCLKSKENCTCLEDSFKKFLLEMNAIPEPEWALKFQEFLVRELHIGNNDAIFAIGKLHSLMREYPN